MSTPWGPGGSPPDPYGPRDQASYGAEIAPYGADPVDPYAGQAAVPVPLYNPYANPGSWEPAQYLPRQSPPGTIIAGSIVGYLLALLLFVEGIFLLFAGSIIGSVSDSSDFTDSGTPLVIGGIGNWIAVGLFVTGGVLVTLRKPAGSILMLVASALVVVLTVYWIALAPVGGIAFWACVHLVSGLVPAGLVAIPPGNRAWLAGQTVSPPRHVGPQPFPTDQYGRPFGS